MDRDCHNGSLYFFVVHKMSQVTVLWEERKREILTIVPFLGGVDMLSTHGRPAGDPRKYMGRSEMGKS